jgi:hypothetical protein
MKNCFSFGSHLLLRLIVFVFLAIKLVTCQTDYAFLTIDNAITSVSTTYKIDIFQNTQIAIDAGTII